MSQPPPRHLFTDKNDSKYEKRKSRCNCARHSVPQHSRATSPLPDVKTGGIHFKSLVPKRPPGWLLPTIVTCARTIDSQACLVLPLRKGQRNDKSNLPPPFRLLQKRGSSFPFSMYYQHWKQRGPFGPARLSYYDETLVQ